MTRFTSAPEMLSACVSELNLTDSGEQGIAKSALGLALRNWTAVGCVPEDTGERHWYRRTVLKRRIAHQIRNEGKVGIDPITGVILWALIQAVVTRVIVWLCEWWWNNRHANSQADILSCCDSLG